MNLSSYHSDGKGFGVNNMKAPIHLLVSMFQTGGVMVLGIFSQQTLGPTKDCLNVKPYLSIVADNVFPL